MSAAATAKDTQTTPSAIAARLCALVAALMSVVQIVQTQYIVLPTGLFKVAHVCLGGTVVCLAVYSVQRWRPDRILAPIAIACLLVAGGYCFYAYKSLVAERAIFANGADVAMSVVFLVGALYASWRQWGWAIPVLALTALLYSYFGYLLPGDLLYHGGMSLKRLMSYTAIPFFQGLLGGLTELSASTIFIFLLLGGVLMATGGVNFILEMARRLGGSSRAGPAQIAVISSGLMGMISGSTVANIASTGSMTIPMMKRLGFRPEFAAAVEASASMGGQLTPPVMGLAAFLIVGLTGTPYAEVMIAAIIPAAIYYLYLMAAVHICAAKYGIDARVVADAAQASGLEHLSILNLVARYIHLVAGVALLVGLLFQQMPAGVSALYAAVFMLAADVVKRMLFGRGGLYERVRDCAAVVFRALEEGGRRGAEVAVILAVIGILVEVLTVTGFAQKLSGAMLELADGRPGALSLIVAMSCVVFGLGLPTPAAYLLVALLGAPALVATGVPLLAAHMFVFYFANVSALTPPVAIAALVAANIAQARFLATAVLCIRLSLPAFLLPFLFLTHPQILGLAGDPWEWAVYGIVALVAVLAMNMALEGYAIGRLGIVSRLLLIVSGAAMLLPGLWPTLAGGAIFALTLAMQRVYARSSRV